MQHYFDNLGEVGLSSKLVVGLMSGTSIDAVDAALVKISPSTKKGFEFHEKLNIKIDTLSTVLYPIPEEVREKLNRIIESKIISLEELCKLNFILGEVFAQAAIEVARSCSISISQVDLIGSHGQTIYHAPEKITEYGYSTQSTLQIGEPSIIAERTGVTTIADFRPRDIAAGGEGAPLVCFADMVLLANSEETRAAQNIGGMANVTVLPHNSPPFAFDTGPGNALIDSVVRYYFDKEYDKDGGIAAIGKVHEDWVDKVIADEPYFKISPPKSTGRELFNWNYIQNVLEKYPLERPDDIVASVTALTAKTIARAYEDFILPQYKPDAIILGGGGAYNYFLISLIDKYLKGSIPIKTHEDYGISNKFKEAIAFALLAYTTYHAIPNNIPSCTGASSNVILGKIIPGRIAFYDDLG